MLPHRIHFLLILVLLHAPGTAWAQFALRRTASSSDVEQAVSATSSPMIPDPDKYPVSAPAVAPEPWRLFQDTKYDFTWLPESGQRSLGILDSEISTTLNIPIGEHRAPLLMTPYIASHHWTLPGGTVGNPSFYDLNVEFAWRPRLAEWLFADLAVTPGYYSDLKEYNADSFQLRGRALAIVACSPQLQFVAGAMYVNRIRTKVLPAGGVIWTPSEDARFFLVFPQPRISQRFTTIGVTQLWSYVAGEFGGGRWEVEPVQGVSESIDYTDLRVMVGIEAFHAQRWRAHVDCGYVFSRRVLFGNSSFEYKPENTLMLRAGIRF